MICHPNRTFPPKELEQESHNRLSPSPHHQTIPSLTSGLWPTTPVLARYKWVCLSPVHAPLPCKSMVCLSFMHLPLSVSLSGLAVHFFCLFLTFCGMGESRSSFFAFRFLLGLHLAWARSLSSSIRPLFPLLLVCGLTSIPNVPLHCLYHVIT